MDVRTLFEMDWYDKSPLTVVLKKYRGQGRWIHFGGAPNRDIRSVKLTPEPERPGSWSRQGERQYQRKLTAVRRQNAVYQVPKLGVNPRSMWQDPKGVYFYPVDFLLSGFERIVSGNQYGLDRPFYYVCDLNLNDPNGVDLGTMTWADVEAIAQRNGWLDQMQEFRQLPPEEQKKQLFSYSRPDLPGSFFWHFIDRNVKDGKMTWNKAFRGVSYIRDPNLSIIHSNEPDQVLVLNPRLIKVLDAGENKAPIKAGGGSDQMEQWWYALLTVIKRVRGEYGGDLTWMKKRPSLKFSKGFGHFELTIPVRSDRMEVGLNLNITYGRAQDQLYINYDTLTKQSLEQIVGTISQRVDQIAKRKTDLLFKPIFPIATGEKIITQQMADNLEMPIDTTIYNSESQRSYDSVSMRGETQREVDRVMIKTACYISMHTDYISGSVNVHGGNQYLISAQSDYQERFTDPLAMMRSIAEKARENFANMGSYYAPKENDRYWRPRFRTQEEFRAFMGWVVVNCGLSLGGELRKLFPDEVAAYEAYPDRDELAYQIRYVLNSRH